jgi:hypothetical protein
MKAMASKLLARLMYEQGNKCFFCNKPLSPANASVEHLVARTNGGSDGNDNCVACCETLNKLLADKPLKEKLRVLLNQKGQFQCPPGAQQPATAGVKAKSPKVAAVTKPAADKFSQIVASLKKLSDKKPRTVSKLRNTINSQNQNQFPPEELSSLVQQLEAKGVITISGTEVTYSS